MPTTRVLLIRHGETDWNAAGRWQGHAPTPLNARGLRQSQALGRYLAAQRTWQIVAIYSSDLPRAEQTARAVAEALGLPVHTDPRLREKDLGHWQGLTREEVRAWDGERYARYLAGWPNVPIPGGETIPEMLTRARAALEEIAARHSGQTVALVSHGGTISNMLHALLPEEQIPSLVNTSLTVLARDADNAPWRLERASWTPHLEGERALGETW